ncbi:hypothetical protein LUZ60_007190 [Juncus effusus]|nr:hypothetical protein LUZ60_007190 [Juncus effusus]
MELETNREIRSTIHYAKSPPSYLDHFDRALSEVLQNQERFYQNESGESSSTSRGRIVISTETDAQLAFDEELARRLQEMENSPSSPDRSSDNDEELECVESPSDSESEDNDESNNSEEVTRQDNIDPDNMTYEELQRLGETVGTENRGLSDELISYLESKKYYSGLFSKKHEECVICQEEYKNREKLIKLPCKHSFHKSCITTWLKIEKTCPVCKYEVFGP